jgi:hypothetical protein
MCARKCSYSSRCQWEISGAAKRRKSRYCRSFPKLRTSQGRTPPPPNGVGGSFRPVSMHCPAARRDRSAHRTAAS